MNVVLLGAPGAGKGTYASRLTGEFDLPHISTGDLLRAAVKNQTELGIKAKEYMNAGQLVPDELVVELLKVRLEEDDAAKGALLDGFPRTIGQAELLEKIVTIDVVLKFDVENEEVIARLSGRRLCKACGAIFHTRNLPPKVDGVCDKCDGALYQRDDDKIEVIKDRLTIYEEQTSPLINYYSEKGLLKAVDANVNTSDPASHAVEDCKEILNQYK